MFPDIHILEERLSYFFRDTELAITALTHTSYAHENKTEHNERLEFLGDAVLGAAVSRLLYAQYPLEKEGALSSYRDFLVCEATLARVARRLDLGSLLRLGKGEIKNGGREKNSILADATEALVAAVYLDAGENGENAALTLVSRLFQNEFSACGQSCDAKSLLQQVVEQGGRERLDYRRVSVAGPAHAPRYTVEALLNSNVIGRGEGGSAHEAEQNAAREALALFGTKND